MANNNPPEKTMYMEEIPSFLKQLARYIARGFYQIEDSLIIDMLVRNPCMKEKDIEDLLKFDLKLLRARMSTLKNEKIVQLRLRMETGPDGKAQKVNYYFINYISLVNVVKYKLDHMRKRMETQERDATNRASFKCTNSSCIKTFTDLEVGELYDLNTNTFSCTFCKSVVEEDESAGPKKDSRLMLARFNEQMQMIFELLKKAEDIKLAPHLLDPEPPKINDEGDGNGHFKERSGIWSGEATRSSGFNDETRIDIKIGDEANLKPKEERKERPVWMTRSTIGEEYNETSLGGSVRKLESASERPPPRDDIMSVLLTYEKRSEPVGKTTTYTQSDSDEEDNKKFNSSNFSFNHEPMEVESAIMDSDDDEVPSIEVGNEKFRITDVDDTVIARMNPTEKEAYIHVYQEHYSYLFD